MKKYIIGLLMIISFGSYAETTCKAYCLSIGASPHPQIDKNVLSNIVYLKQDSASSLVEFCTDIGGSILANSYTPLIYSVSSVTYLDKYVPATEGNSCYDFSNRPLMDYQE